MRQEWSVSCPVSKLVVSIIHVILAECPSIEHGKPGSDNGTGTSYMFPIEAGDEHGRRLAMRGELHVAAV